jgi:hypothetical protein
VRAHRGVARGVSWRGPRRVVAWPAACRGAARGVSWRGPRRVVAWPAACRGAARGAPLHAAATATRRRRTTMHRFVPDGRYATATVFTRHPGHSCPGVAARRRGCCRYRPPAASARVGDPPGGSSTGRGRPGGDPAEHSPKPGRGDPGRRQGVSCSGSARRDAIPNLLAGRQPADAGPAPGSASRPRPRLRGDPEVHDAGSGGWRHPYRDRPTGPPPERSRARSRGAPKRPSSDGRVPRRSSLPPLLRRTPGRRPSSRGAPRARRTGDASGRSRASAARAPRDRRPPTRSAA